MDIGYESLVLLALDYNRKQHFHCRLHRRRHRRHHHLCQLRLRQDYLEVEKLEECFLNRLCLFLNLRHRLNHHCFRLHLYFQHHRRHQQR